MKRSRVLQALVAFVLVSLAASELLGFFRGFSTGYSEARSYVSAESRTHAAFESCRHLSPQLQEGQFGPDDAYPAELNGRFAVLFRYIEPGDIANAEAVKRCLTTATNAPVGAERGSRWDGWTWEGEFGSWFAFVAQ